MAYISHVRLCGFTRNSRYLSHERPQRLGSLELSCEPICPLQVYILNNIMSPRTFSVYYNSRLFSCLLLPLILEYFQRLIRFIATDEKTYYGNAILPSGITDVSKVTKANLIEGNIFDSHKVTEKVLVNINTTVSVSFLWFLELT